MISCKLHSAERIRAEYGATAAGESTTCARLNRRTLDAVMLIAHRPPEKEDAVQGHASACCSNPTEQATQRSRSGSNPSRWCRPTPAARCASAPRACAATAPCASARSARGDSGAPVLPPDRARLSQAHPDRRSAAAEGGVPAGGADRRAARRRAAKLGRVSTVAPRRLFAPRRARAFADRGPRHRRLRVRDPVARVGGRSGDPWRLATALVFGLSALAMFVTSVIYHWARDPARKLPLRKLDHSAIYLLIAGTYTPFTLVAMEGAWGWSLFGVVWTLAVFGIVAKTTVGFRYPQAVDRAVSRHGVAHRRRDQAAAREPDRAASSRGSLAGGLLYTGGVPFYVWKIAPLHARGVAPVRARRRRLPLRRGAERGRARRG